MPEVNSKIDQHEIISLLRQNNGRAADALYERFGSVLFGVALKLSNNEEAAEEILSKAIVHIKENHSDFVESKQSLLLWMIAVLRNTAACHNASAENRSLAFYVGDGADESYHVENKSLLTSPVQRRILDMVLFGGKKINEVATQLEMDEQTVRQLLREAVNQYRKESAQVKWT